MAAAASFTLDPALRKLSALALLKKYESLTPEERVRRGFVRKATPEEFAAANAQHGAPADFGGAVYSSPKPVVISDDTDSGIPVTPMPTGVSFQKQNATGALHLDTSSPPAAELARPTLHTVGANMSAAPVQLDMSTAQPIGAPASQTPPQGGVKLDMSTAQPIDTAASPAKPGFWERAYQTSGAKGLIDQAKKRDQEIRDMYSRVGDHLQQGDFGGAVSELAQHAGKVAAQTGEEMPAVAILKSQASQIPKAIAAAKAGDYATAAGRGLAAITPLVGPAAADTGEKLGTDVGEGNFAGAAGDVAGFAGPLVAGKVVAAAPEIGAGLSDAAVAGVRAVGKGIQRAAGSDIGQAVGQVATQIGEGADPDVVGLVSPRSAHALRLAAKTGKVIAKNSPAAPPPGTVDNPAPAAPPATAAAPTEAPNASPAAAQGPPNPEEMQAQFAAQREARNVAGLQAQTLAQQPPELPTPAAAPKPAIKPSQVEQTLREALGASPPLKKNAPIYQRTPSAPATTPTPTETAAPAPLPKNFTPVKSTVLKGYNYDPETHEFHSVTNSGKHYVTGEITPKDVEDFQNADSQGSAWTNIIRSRGTPLGEMVEGKLKPWRTKGVTATPDDLSPLDQKLKNLQDFIRPAEAKTATQASSSDDLTSVLDKSVDLAKHEGVFTSVEPKALLDRWGVDPESFAAGREQTRGMKPQESADFVDKLSATYKKGRRVDPVIETRDAQNNIVEVDGRGRALAAHKAGIDRIPVIVRRLQ